MALELKNPAWGMAGILMDCLQGLFVDGIVDYPTPGNFCFRANEAPITDDLDPMTGEDLCCQGLGWVRIGNTFPSSNFPEPDTDATKCFPTSWALELEVGLLRCYVPAGQEHMADCAQHTDNAIADSLALRILQETACCFGREIDKISRGRLWLIQGITVNGPRGNCIDRTMNLLVQSPKCC
jgi:hypothetical protein